MRSGNERQTSSLPLLERNERLRREARPTSTSKKVISDEDEKRREVQDVSLSSTRLESGSVRESSRRRR
jgi:hypothetical protein